MAPDAATGTGDVDRPPAAGSVMTVGPDGTGTNETSVVLSLAFVVLGATKLPVVSTRLAPSERETAPKATPAAPMARAAAIAATTVRRRGFVTDPRVPRLRRLHKDGSV